MGKMLELAGLRFWMDNTTHVWVEEMLNQDVKTIFTEASEEIREGKLVEQ